MIRNGMWNVFYITNSQNKEKEWDLLLHHSKFPLECVIGFAQSLLKGSKTDQYIFSEPDVVRSVPDEYFVKRSSSEGTGIGAADSNRT